MAPSFTLTLTCAQRPGIVHAVSSFLLQQNCDIAEHQQFDDTQNGAFFLRTSFVPVDNLDVKTLTSRFQGTATEFGMNFEFSNNDPARVIVMVSRMGHCLNDLLFRWRAASLGGDIIAVVSNHLDLRPMAEAADLPFFHIPVTPAGDQTAGRDRPATAPVRQSHRSPALTVDPEGGAMELSVLCGRGIVNYRRGCSGHVLPGGRLRIVDPSRGIVATYPPGCWTILTAPSGGARYVLID